MLRTQPEAETLLIYGTISALPPLKKRLVCRHKKESA